MNKGIQLALDLTKKRGLALQAGGHHGWFPLELDRHFDRVVTFEPVQENWKKLESNIEGTTIRAINAALSDRRYRAGMINPKPANSGCWHLTGGDEVDVMTIDDLKLDACDLIYLDIEGAELWALRGAEQTIKNFSPVIGFESKRLGLRYFGVMSPEHYLESLGYKHRHKVQHDVFMVRG